MKVFRYIIVSILFAFLIGFSGTISAYDQVEMKKTVPLTVKTITMDIMREDIDGNFWILDRDSAFFDQITSEGKIRVVIKPGKKPDILYKEAFDFVFSREGKLVVSDPGTDSIVFIGEKPSKDKIKFTNPVLLSRFPVINPGAIAMSSDDILAVGDEKGKRILIFSVDGTLLHSLTVPTKEPFKSITALAFAKDGQLWALDGDAGIIHRFSPERAWLGGTDGFKGGRQIVIDDYGFAYVTLSQGRWKEVNKDGQLTGTFGAKGQNPGEMKAPTGLVWKKPNSLWVADSGNKRFELYTITNADKKNQLIPAPAARLQVRQGPPSLITSENILFYDIDQVLTINAKKSFLEWRDKSGKVTSTFGKKGKGTGGLNEPVSVARGPDGAIWIVDQGDDSLKLLTIDGNIQKVLGEKGKKEGNLYTPHRIAIRPDGSFVVSDRGDSRLQVFNNKGIFLFMVGDKKKKKELFGEVSGLAVNESLIAVMDNDKKALFFYDSNGKFISQVANKDDAKPVWKKLSSLVTDPQGNFYCLDSDLGRIRIFDFKGKFLGDVQTTGRGLVMMANQRLLVLGEKDSHTFDIAIVPKAVENLKAKEEGGYIRIAWEKNPQGVTYSLYKSSESGEFSLLYSSSALTYLDRIITPGMNYQYAVAARNSLGYDGNWMLTDLVKGPKRTDTSLISISSSALNPVFAAAFKYYVDHPIGTVTLENNSDRVYRDVKLSLSLKNYTDFPTEKVIESMRPGEVIQVPVTMTFNDKIIELSENTPVQMDIRVSFFEDNKQQSVTKNGPLLIYSRNAIMWDDKNRISSFITPKDPPVLEFARSAIKEFLAPLKSSTVGKPLAKAALMYESMNGLRISYVPDPKSAYSEVSKSSGALDYVQFPRETMRRKTGDCDDTTALLAALLSSVGVDVALVDSPGHIFLMINTEEDDAWRLGLPVERFVSFKGTYWVPVETTRLGKDFSEAWQSGTSEIKEAGDKAVFTPLSEAEAIYPAVTILEKEDKAQPYPLKEVQASFPNDLKKLQDGRYQNQLATVKEEIKKNPGDESLKIKLGMVQFEGTHLDEARVEFEALLKSKNPDIQSATHNNLGNISFIAEDYKSALSHYKDAALLNPKDGGVLINEARCSLALGDKESAKKLLSEAKGLTPPMDPFTTDIPAELLPK